MPAPRKYDQETRDRAARMYQERRRDSPNESALQSRKRVGELLDVRHDTLRGGSSGSRLTPAARSAQVRRPIPGRGFRVAAGAMTTGVSPTDGAGSGSLRWR